MNLVRRANRANNNNQPSQEHKPKVPKKEIIDNSNIEAINKISVNTSGKRPSNSYIDPEVIRDIQENPDWKLEEPTDPELAELVGNLNNLMTAVRLTLAKIQQTQRTTERVKIDYVQDKVKDNIKGSKKTTLEMSMYSFFQGIVTLTLAITPALPELKERQELFDGISRSSQALFETAKKGSEAVNGELTNMIGLLNQEINSVTNGAQTSQRTLEQIIEALSNMTSARRIY